MPKYTYTARDSAGVAIAGHVVAHSDTEAARLLRGEGKFVTNINEAPDYDETQLVTPRIGASRVKPDEVVYFINQLAAMVDTGVTIADALEAAIDKTPPGGFRTTVEDVIQEVQGGTDFSAALARHSKVFPPLMAHMVRASEATGTLGTMLCRIADYIVNQREVKKRIKGALIYPTCMLIFSVGATIFLLTFVLPKFAGIYGTKNAILPLPTRILMGTSALAVDYWMYLVAGAAATIVGGILFFRSHNGQYAADWMRVNMPIFGRMYRKAYLARSLRTLGTMISAGVSVLDAVNITRDVVGNRLFGRVFDNVHRQLEEGEQLSAALLDAPYFPRPVWQMLHAGERTGQLGQAMQRVSDFCESDLKTTIRTMTQFIEPAMIIVMGTIIGTIALAILLPIFQMSKVITQ